MKIVKLAIKERSYKIIIKRNVFKDVVFNHLSKYKNSKAIIITDKNVAKHYFEIFSKLFEKSNIEIQTIVA